MRRRIITTLLVTVPLATGLVQLRAIGPVPATVLVVLTLAVSIALRPAARTVDGLWPPASPDRRPGGRRDVTDLAWAAYTRDGTTTSRVLHRVRLIAAHRLATRGVLWDGRPGAGAQGWGATHTDGPEHRARAAALLGPDVLAGLTSTTAVTARTLEIWFHALDALVAAPEAGPPPSARVPAAPPTARRTP